MTMRLWERNCSLFRQFASLMVWLATVLRHSSFWSAFCKLIITYYTSRRPCQERFNDRWTHRDAYRPGEPEKWIYEPCVSKLDAAAKWISRSLSEARRSKVRAVRRGIAAAAVCVCVCVCLGCGSASRSLSVPYWRYCPLHVRYPR